MEEDTEERRLPPKKHLPDEHDKSKKDMAIALYNLLALAFYTVICVILKEGAPIYDAIFISIHVFVCLILSIAYRKSAWLLSGLLVLLIGFSTCAGILWKLT